MDSLDEKQKAFEERMSEKGESNDVSKDKQADIKRLKQTMAKEKRRFQQQPIFMTMKYNTFEGFMKSLAALAQKWKNGGGNEYIVDPTNPLAKMRSQVYQSCCNQLLVQMQMFTNQVQKETPEVQREIDKERKKVEAVLNQNK